MSDWPAEIAPRGAGLETPLCPELGAPLAERFDAVVMLTMSDWRIEPRSNRYHYATRFATQLPTLFVQPDRSAVGYNFEPTEVPGLTVLHVPPYYLEDRRGRPLYCRHLARALRHAGVLRPLLWLSNFKACVFYSEAYSPLKVYHATENYFLRDFFSLDGENYRLILASLRASDAVIAVSSDIKERCDRITEGRPPALLLPNGCDYTFLARSSIAPIERQERPAAIFQGNLNRRVDFDLLHGVAQELPDWQIWLCGAMFAPEVASCPVWQALIRRPNVRYFGALPVEQLRDRMTQATVGMIPFRQTEIIATSFPLKAFEYVACGLPVVTVPIHDLAAYPELFHTATDPQSFAAAIRAAAPTRLEPGCLERRRAAAQERDYDGVHRTACRFLQGVRPPANQLHAGNVLVLFDDGSVHVKTIEHHLAAFKQYSQHHIYYAPATRGAACPYDLSAFDVVVLHYSVRVSLPDHLSPAYRRALRDYVGLKVLYIQDEYDWTDLACQYITDLGVHLVFTCVPNDQIERVYPRARFPHVEFTTTLTGYVPIDHDPSRPVRPLHERPYLIGYRGRRLGYWYGDLGQEKRLIGDRMRAICDRLGLPTDIETDDWKRIYGDAWFAFLESCRAMLGTESGANCFDFDGTLRERVEAELRANPAVEYAEVRAKILEGHEGRVVMNQISPKIFESIIHRTALILFEGTYSGVVRPFEHFLPLKKDFSNAEEILSQLQDDAFVSELTERAYHDVIASGRYSYRAMAEQFDAKLAQYRVASRPRAPLSRSSHGVVPGQSYGQTRVAALDGSLPCGLIVFRLPPLPGGRPAAAA